jgi:hypothetical protein
LIDNPTEARALAGMTPALIFDGLDARALSSKVLEQIFSDLCNPAGQVRAAYKPFTDAVSQHLIERREAVYHFEHAQHEARLAREQAASRQRVAEQQAAAQAIAEVRRQFKEAAR